MRINKNIIYLTLSSLLIYTTCIAQEGSPRTPYDRGTTASTIAFNDLDDLGQMLKSYGDCGEPGMVGLCYYWVPTIVSFYFTPPKFEPYWDYYVPFQKVETDEKMFATGYFTKEEVQMAITLSDQVLYPNATGFTTAALNHMNTASAANGWGVQITNTDVKQEYLTEVQKIDLMTKRMRNPLMFESGHRYQEAHVVRTFFDEVFRGAPYFNTKDIEQPWTPMTWAHHGAKWGDDPDISKYRVPKWMNSQPEGILFDRFFALVSGTFNDARDKVPSLTDKMNCMPRKIQRHGNNEVLPANMLTALSGFNDDQTCLPGALGLKFSGPLNSVETVYATDADNVAIYRGLRAAYKIGNPAYAATGMHFKDLTATQEGDRKRDRIQYLFRKNQEYQGCAPFKAEPHFIPNKWGPEWGKLNETVNNPQGERFVAVHWRYVRNCRRPIPPEIREVFGPKPFYYE